MLPSFNHGGLGGLRQKLRESRRNFFKHTVTQRFCFGSSLEKYSIADFLSLCSPSKKLTQSELDLNTI
jgi:hypothetical protein